MIRGIFRKGIIAAAIVACASLVAAGGAAAASSTSVTIKRESDHFSGDVNSGAKGCEISRIVVLYKQKGKRPNPGNDKFIGSDYTESNGTWAIFPGSMKGKFYAYAPKTGDCRGDKSKTI